MDVMFWVWLGVIIVTAIVEFATMEVVSIWFTIGAIIPFILAATGAVNWIWQVVIFVVLSAIMIVCLRSVTKRFLLKNSNEKTNVDSLIGQKVRMLSRTDFETVGSVKVNDVVWSAIGFSQQTIEKDEIVTILSVQGNKLVVKKDKEEPEVVEEEKKPARKKSEKKESKHKTNEVAAENSAEKVEKKEVTEQKAENIEKDAEKVEKKKVPAKKPSKSKTKEPKKKIAATENDTEKVEKKVSTKKPAKSKVEETKKKATTTKKTSTKTSSKSKTTSSSTKNTKSATKNTKSATKSAANKRS